MSDITEWSALAVLSILQTFNVIVVLGIFQINDYEYLLPNKILYIGIYIFFGILNFVIFIRKRNYDYVIKIFTKGKPIDIIYPILFYCYVISTVWLLFSIGEQVRDINLGKKEDQKLYQLPHN
jgi:hypothetical protein